MPNSTTFRAYPAGQQRSRHSAEPRQSHGNPPGARQPRWLRQLHRVLRFGKRRTPAVTPPPALVTPTMTPEQALDFAAAMASFDRLYELAPRLRRAWSADTSVLPDSWNRERPARGQSAATACVVQDALGGDIVETKLVMGDGRAVSHFANVIDGLVIDLAQTGVEHATSIPGPADGRGGFASMRAYVLAQPGAQAGYAALRARLSEIAGRAR